MSASITSLSVEKTSFPVVTCARCGKQALTYLDPVEDEPVRRSLCCDELVTAVELVGRRSIERMGYVFIGRDRSAQSGRPPQSKCGSGGVRSCGSGGCSSGSCGTGGGGCGGGCSSKA